VRSWLVLVAALVLAGCSTEVAGTPAAPESVDLAVRFEMRPVLPTGATERTEVLPGPDGDELGLGDPILTIARLDSAEVSLDQNSGAWVLTLDLTDADARTFGDWTAAHVGEQLAIVADDEVIIAPVIQSAITGGQVQIAANYTQTEAKALLAELTGR
jgi:preprotein translocase subunit SecD